jgi:hypothetical protein
MYGYGGREEEENEEQDKKNGDCELLKEFISTNISNVFHLAVCTISK